MQLSMVTDDKPIATRDGHTIYVVEFGDGATARVASKKPLAPGQFMNLTPPTPTTSPNNRPTTATVSSPTT
jgi:hypothetical protein